jgi:hypothetical protein
MEAEAIFAMMRKINPLGLLLRAAILAVVGFVLFPGLASAHGGPMAAGEPTYRENEVQPARYAYDALANEAQPASIMAAEQQGHDAGPCAGQPSADHFADSCCNIACHAALAAGAIDDPGTCKPGGSRPAGLADMLVGHPGDRTERPPKRG